MASHRFGFQVYLALDPRAVLYATGLRPEVPYVAKTRKFSVPSSFVDQMVTPDFVFSTHFMSNQWNLRTPKGEWFAPKESLSIPTHT